jgi:hypothetical protein
MKKNRLVVAGIIIAATVFGCLQRENTAGPSADTFLVLRQSTVDAFLNTEVVRAYGSDVMRESTVFFENPDQPDLSAVRVDLAGEPGTVRRLLGFTRGAGFACILVEASSTVQPDDPEAHGTVKYIDLSGLMPTRTVVFDHGVVVSSEESPGSPVTIGGKAPRIDGFVGDILGAGTCQLAKWIAERRYRMRCPGWCTAWWNVWPSCLFCLLSLCANSAG